MWCREKHEEEGEAEAEEEKEKKKQREDYGEWENEPAEGRGGEPGWTYAPAP